MSIEVHRITWQGHADGVAVKTFMPRFPHYLPMRETAGTWWVYLHLPRDARIEYRLEIRRGKRYESTLDAGCSEIATNPFGENSVLRGSEYPASPPRAPTIAWRHTEFRVQSAAFGARRHHHLLSPAGVGDREVLPLVVLLDGSDYRAHADLESVLGAAVHTERLPRFRVALIDPRHRNTEFAADSRLASHIVDEVLPRLESLTGPTRILGGASLGAVAAWHTLWSRPGVFTGLVLQSGTFAFTNRSELPDEMEEPIRVFLQLALDEPRLDSVAVGQTCGRFESLIDWNRAVADRLGHAAGDHRYEERWTGHDWGAWSDMLPEALSTAFRS